MEKKSWVNIFLYFGVYFPFNDEFRVHSFYLRGFTYNGRTPDEEKTCRSSYSSTRPLTLARCSKGWTGSRCTSMSNWTSPGWWACYLVSTEWLFAQRKMTTPDVQYCWRPLTAYQSARKTARHLTTFVTPFDRYRYKTASQGYIIASGDGYTRLGIRHSIQNKMRWWCPSLVRYSWNQSSGCGHNGITLNLNKLMFAEHRDNVDLR